MRVAALAIYRAADRLIIWASRLAEARGSLCCFLRRYRQASTAEDAVGRPRARGGDEKLGCVQGSAHRQATYQRQPSAAFAQGPGARAPAFAERASARGRDERRAARRAVSPDRPPTSVHRLPTAVSTEDSPGHVVEENRIAPPLGWLESWKCKRKLAGTFKGLG